MSVSRCAPCSPSLFFPDHRRHCVSCAFYPVASTPRPSLIRSIGDPCTTFSPISFGLSGEPRVSHVCLSDIYGKHFIHCVCRWTRAANELDTCHFGNVKSVFGLILVPYFSTVPRRSFHLAAYSYDAVHQDLPRLGIYIFGGCAAVVSLLTVSHRFQVWGKSAIRILHVNDWLWWTGETATKCHHFPKLHAWTAKRCFLVWLSRSDCSSKYYSGVRHANILFCPCAYNFSIV